MITYTDLTIYFGSHLTDKNFQSFLTKTFTDLTAYNILQGNYITSDLTGIELGFTNNDAVYDDDTEVIFEEGNPIFSHFVLRPKSQVLINELPFGVLFGDNRKEILTKSGQPTKTNQGEADFYFKAFLVDNYKVETIVVSFDYDKNNEALNFIQVRDNNLVDHLKL